MGQHGVAAAEHAAAKGVPQQADYLPAPQGQGEERRCGCRRACERAAAEGRDCGHAGGSQEGEGDGDHGRDEGGRLPPQDPYGPRRLPAVWHPPAQPPDQGGQGVDAPLFSSESLASRRCHSLPRAIASTCVCCVSAVGRGRVLTWIARTNQMTRQKKKKKKKTLWVEPPFKKKKKKKKKS